MKIFTLFATVLVLASVVGASQSPIQYFRQDLTTLQENGVGLEWSTTPESSWVYFALERAVNHEPWKLLKLQGGFGTKQNGGLYGFVDPPIPHLAIGSVLEYRLITKWSGSTDTSLITIRWGMCSTFEIASFDAVRRSDGVLVRWNLIQCDEVTREFQVWRAEVLQERAGKYQKIYTTTPADTPTIETSGVKQFKLLDRPPQGRIFSYRLVAVLWNGWTHEHVRQQWWVSSTTDVETTPTPPVDFSLAQNYPNPFNPTTTIVYELAQSGPVQLQVIDVNGRVIATLVNGSQSAGRHSIILNAQNLASGIYFYRLQAGNRVDVKRMTLLK